MKKLIFLFLCLCFFKNLSFAESYNYIKPEVFKKMSESGKKFHLIDVQKEEDFEKRNIKGSVKTASYPVKSDEDKKKLDTVIDKVKKDNLDIIIICPKGGGAAKGAYDYFKSKGVVESRLFILEGGIQGFPYNDMCQTK